MMLFVALAATPLAALVDPNWAVRASHAAAIRAAIVSQAPITPAVLCARLSAQGQRYKLPVNGRPLRSAIDDPPGLLMATAAGSPVFAPMRARVAYAGPFRRYGDVLILDHGHGWTTVLTGLDRHDVAQGATLESGDIVGRSADRVRIQLLHHGRPADVARAVGLVIPPQGGTR